MSRRYWTKKVRQRLASVLMAFTIALSAATAITVTTAVPAMADNASEIAGAISWAKNQVPSTAWDGYCLVFVYDAYKDGANLDIGGADSAYDYWLAHPKAQVKNGSTPPEGALVFWGPTTGTYANPYGHVALSLGSGNAISSEERNYTGVHTFAISDRSSYPYLGWMMPPGVSVPSDTPTSGPATSPPATTTPPLCATSNGLSVLANCPETLEGDFNGDGLTDLVHLTSNGVDTWLSTGWGSYNLIRTNFEPIANYGMGGCIKWVTGDFNADGKTDLACIWSGGVDVWFSNGDGTYTFNGTYGLSGYGMTGCNWVTGDFNGDGKMDLACIWGTGSNNGGVDVWTSNGDGTFTVAATYRPASYNMANCQWKVGDFDTANAGSTTGRADLACIWSGGVQLWFSNGDGTFNVANTYLPWTGYNMTGGFYWKVADVTGTGTDSLVYFWNGGIDTWRSNSDGTFTVNTQLAPSGYTMQGGDWQFGDFNGDGMTDIVNINKNGVDTWLSNGVGGYDLVAMSQVPAGYNMTAGITFMVGQVTGTGYDSLIHIWSSSTAGGINTWYAYGSTGSWYVAGPYSVSGYVMTGGTWF